MKRLIAVDHGRIRVHLPADWEDRSALLFIAPAHEAPVAPLSAKEPERKHRNLSVTLDPTEMESIEAYVRSLGVAEVAAISIAGRTGASGERRIAIDGGWVRQLVAAVLVSEGLALLAIGSADEGSFEAHRAELLSLIERIELS
jgi:hypothetical protein